MSKIQSRGISQYFFLVRRKRNSSFKKSITGNDDLKLKCMNKI
jgi:hypothetical protein